MTTISTTTRIEKTCDTMSTKKTPKKKSSSSFYSLIRSDSHRADDSGDDLLCKETHPHYFPLFSCLCLCSPVFHFSTADAPVCYVFANFPIGLITVQCSPQIYICCWSGAGLLCWDDPTGGMRLLPFLL